MQEELSAIPASALSIPGVLRALGEASPPGGRVLSVYLDISPDRSAGRAYLLAYRARIKGLRALLPVGEHGRFEAAAEQVERYLAEQLVPHHPGVAVFASGEPSYFFAVPVPTRPFDTVQWGERPVLEPLEALLDDYERVAVLLFDKERARLFSVYLGAIEERRTILYQGQPVEGMPLTRLFPIQEGLALGQTVESVIRLPVPAEGIPTGEYELQVLAMAGRSAESRNVKFTVR